MLQSIRLSVRPMFRTSQQRCTLSFGYYRTLIGSPMLDVKPALISAIGSAAETATKPSLAPLQKHSLSDCKFAQSICSCRTVIGRAYRFAAR